MIIRASQMDALREVSARSFENEMVTHLTAFDPHHAQVIGDEGLRRVIRLGLDNAAGFGFTKRGPVRLYLEAMLMLGSDLAADPIYSWAGGILGGPCPLRFSPTVAFSADGATTIAALAGLGTPQARVLTAALPK